MTVDARPSDETRFFSGSARMYSFLGDLFSVLLACLLWLPTRLAEEFALSIDGCMNVIRNWLEDSQDSTQQTIASSQSSTGPPKDWLTCIGSFLWRRRLARVRVPSRRSVR